MRAVVYSGRAVLRGRAAGLHEASAYVLWTDDTGRVGAADVQACGSSSAAVWGVEKEESRQSTVNPFGKLRAGSSQQRKSCSKTQVPKVGTRAPSRIFSLASGFIWRRWFALPIPCGIPALFQPRR